MLEYLLSKGVPLANIGGGLRREGARFLSDDAGRGDSGKIISAGKYTPFGHSDYQSIVADINVDMFLPIVPLKVLKIEGIAESDLGDRAAAIARSLGVKPIPDPEPLRNTFIRSDQYNFIRHGVPSLIMSVSAEPGTPEQAIFKAWLTKRYHAPSDDLNQPVDLGAAALYEEITRRLLLDVADTPARPAWKPDSFFRRYAEAGSPAAR